MTAPADPANRRTWRSLGLAVEGGSEIVPVSLPPIAADADALSSRRGPGPDDARPDINVIDDPVPDLGRWMVRAGPGFVPAVTDADGGMLSGWQQRSQGRVALWTVANSFALVLNGQADRYYQWWSDTVSAVSRPDSTFRPDVPALPEVGARMAVCGVAASARVIAPDASQVALAIDPLSGAAGCAAYWPTSQGVHTIVQTGRGGRQEFAFAVLPQRALDVAKATQIGEATTRWAAAQNTPMTREAPDRRGPSWPYFIAWLLVSGMLWFAERRWRSRSGHSG